MYIVLLVLLTAFILVLGILSMAAGDKISRKFGTTLMSLRVTVQALTLVSLLIVYYLYSKS